MAKQLHKRFSDGQVKMLLKKYTNEKVELRYILETLRIRRRRFLELLKEYKKDPDNFSIQYERKRGTRKISDNVEKNIINELAKETFWQHILALLIKLYLRDFLAAFSFWLFQSWFYTI